MKKTICLNMIVKNESAVIGRCLASVKSVIDHWVIVDTGSSDGTQSIIRKCLQGVPGELYERPWVDFAFNRNEVLALAKGKGDYFLLLDADESLDFATDFIMPELMADVYYVCVQATDVIIYRELLIKSCLEWKWVGILHEGLISRQARTGEILPGVINHAIQDGNRSQNPKKFLRDAEILEQALAKNPHDSRNVMYLAISYAQSGLYKKAIENYEKRLLLGGESEEIFHSMLSIGELQELMKMPPDDFISSYSRAYEYRPSRIEPLFCLARYFIEMNQPLLGYLLSRYALTVPFPSDRMFVRFSYYDFEALAQFAESAFTIGREDESDSAYGRLIAQLEKLLKHRRLPPDRVKIIQEVLPGMKAYLRSRTRLSKKES